MNDLEYQIARACRSNRDGSFGTQAVRQRGLRMMARQLHAELGLKVRKAENLKRKHVAALVEHWNRSGVSTGTVKNRLSMLRWLLEKVNRAGVMPKANAGLGVAQRQYVTGENKAAALDPDKLSQIQCPYLRASLELQREFGLRREESIKFIPDYADRGDKLILKGSWTKGGRPREIPILTDSQRVALDHAHLLAGKSSLIPSELQYKHQQQKYERACAQVGLHKMHGLRHAYAQRRYEQLTGWKPPAAGGPHKAQMTGEDQIKDRWARQIITEELGHGRGQVTSIYLGSP